MLFLEKFGQEIRPDAQKISHCITLLMAKWDGGFGGGGGGKNSFRRDVIAVMVKARGSKAGNACSFIRTHP